MIIVIALVLTLIGVSSGQLQIQAQTRKFSLPARSVIPARVPQPVPYPRVYVRPDDESYKPFAFNYDNTDEYGTRLTREESQDASGTVRGSYSYRDATGLQRIVTYIADHNGFRANVDSNEPGLIPHSPADVTYNVAG